MTTARKNSRLSQQAEKFLLDESLHSSDSSIDLHRSLSPSYKSRSKLSRKNTQSQLNELEKSTKTEKSKLNSTASILKSPTQKLKSPEPVPKPEPGKTHIPIGRKHSMKSPKIEELISPHSCQQEKYLLRIKVSDLESTLNGKDKKVKKLYERVLEKREEVKDLTNQLLESRKKSLGILDLKEKIRALEDNERNLIQELNAQQKEAKDMMYKLYAVQEEWSLEAERSKKEYQEYCVNWLEEQKAQWKTNITLLEEENWKLVTKIKEMQSLEEIEWKRMKNEAHKEVVALKTELDEKDLEIESLKDDIRAFREALREADRISILEKKSLQSSVDLLSDQNRVLRSNEEEIANRDQYDKTLLKKKVELLQDELRRKDRAMQEKELYHREQVESLNRKIANLQFDLKGSGGFPEKIDKLEKSLAMKDAELTLSKRLFDEQLESKRVSQEQQKKEWSNTYHDLLIEIKELKGEINSLQGHNKRLANSLNPQQRREG